MCLPWGGRAQAVPERPRRPLGCRIIDFVCKHLLIEGAEGKVRHILICESQIDFQILNSSNWKKRGRSLLTQLRQPCLGVSSEMKSPRGLLTTAVAAAQ